MKIKHLAGIAIACLAIAFSCQAQGDSNAKGAKVKGEVTQEAKPRLITKAEFLSKVVDYEKNPDKWVYLGDKPCLIDFYADWCGPCRELAPSLEKMAQEYAGKIDVYKINIDKEQELAAVFGVQSIPTLLFCPMKGRPQIATGLMGQKTLQRAIREVLLPDGE